MDFYYGSKNTPAMSKMELAQWDYNNIIPKIVKNIILQDNLVKQCKEIAITLNDNLVNDSNTSYKRFCIADFNDSIEKAKQLVENVNQNLNDCNASLYLVEDYVANTKDDTAKVLIYSLGTFKKNLNADLPSIIDSGYLFTL